MNKVSESIVSYFENSISTCLSPASTYELIDEINRNEHLTQEQKDKLIGLCWDKIRDLSVYYPISEVGLITDMIEYSPKTLTISNCDKIYLCQTGADIKVSIDKFEIDKYDFIEINGRRFEVVE